MHVVRTLDHDLLEAALRRCGADIAPGLSESEFDRLEDQFGLRFAPDHRLLLSIGLPTDEARKWPDWRSATDGSLRERLTWPSDGLLFDVEHAGLWHPSWGERPDALADAIEKARAMLLSAPRLIPLYAHRMMPTDPPEAGNPVLSVMQSDIIYYGVDLLDWFDREFHRSSTSWDMPTVERVLPFWTWLLEADE